MESALNMTIFFTSFSSVSKGAAGLSGLRVFNNSDPLEELAAKKENLGNQQSYKQ